MECWSLTVYCPKLRLCLKSRKLMMPEMTVWARVKRSRDDFSPLLIFWVKHNYKCYFYLKALDKHLTTQTVIKHLLYLVKCKVW